MFVSSQSRTVFFGHLPSDEGPGGLCGVWSGREEAAHKHDIVTVGK